MHHGHLASSLKRLPPMQEIESLRPTRKQASGDPLQWCRDPDGSEVYEGQCNGGQRVDAVQVNLTPLI